jgi:hypothetical protein
VPAGCGEKIFEQFYRAHDSLSNGIQGSGLGLTLARQIARAHGGDVVYEPRDGGGSCFTLRIPVLASEPTRNRNPEPAASQHCHQGVSATPTGDGPRAVPGSQQPQMQTGAQISSALPTRSNALRAGDGSRSGGGAKLRPPETQDQSK